MLLGFIVSMLVFGLLAALMVEVAVCALPVEIGIILARLAADSGAGVLGTLIVGGVAAVLAFVAGHVMLLLAGSRFARLLAATAFAIPAALAAYPVSLAVARMSGAVGLWQTILAGTAASLAALTSIRRLAGFSRAVRRAPTNANVSRLEGKSGHCSGARAGGAGSDRAVRLSHPCS